MLAFSFCCARQGLGMYLLFLLLMMVGTFVSGTKVTIFDASKIPTPDGDATTDALTTDLMSQGINEAYKDLPSFYQNKVSLVDISSYGSDVESALAAAIKELGTPTAVIGVYGDSNIEGALTVIADTNLTLFGGLVGGVPHSVWNPKVVAAKMSPDGEMLLLLKYAITIAHVNRIGFMYTTGVSVGEELHTLAVSYLDTINASYQLVVYAQPYSSSFNSGNFSSFAADSPNVVIVQSKPGAHMASFVTEWMTNSQTKSGDILGGTFQQQQLLSLYTANKNTMTGKVFIASSVPPKSGSGLTAMDTMLTALPSATDATANIMFYGYSSMMALSYAVQSYVTADELYNNILVSFTRFLYKDYVIGFYGGPYDEVLASQGAVSQCNQGGQSVWMISYDTDLTGATEDTHANFQPTCGIQGYLPSATRLVCLEYEDELLKDFYIQGCTALQSDPVPDLALGAIKAITGEITSYHRIIVNTTEADSLEDFSKKYQVEVVMGPVDLSTSLPTDVILWNPILTYPEINMFRDNEYYFTPTLAQDMIMLYAYLSTAANPPVSDTKTVTAIVRSLPEKVWYIQEAAMGLGVQFERTVYSENLEDGILASTVMWNSGYNMLVGVNKTDVPDIFQFLDANTNCAVFFPYRTMTTIYPTVKTTAKNAVLPRILTDSNIPYWNDTTKTPIAHEMQTGLDFLRMNAYQFLGGSSSPTYSVPLVPNGIMVADNVTIGPFYAAGWMNPLTGKISSSNRNWGASTTYLVDGEKAFKNSGSFPIYELQPDAVIFKYATTTTTTSTTTTTTEAPQETTTTTTEEPKTTEEPTEKSTNKWGILLWILVVIGALSLFFLVLFMCYTKFFIPKGIIGNPPKEKDRTITIIFTDVDYSAALWTELPELQRVASAEHDQIIRELIIKYKGYEVFSDGNRFMIALANPYRAVQLAAELQVAMLQHNWRTSKFDEWYLMMEQSLTTDGATSITHELSPEEYKALWKGLRVRVGVHSGFCGMHFQKSVRKFRYFGRTVDTSLRVEEKAIGGQVLVTGATWDLLTPDEIASIDHTFLGPTTIRGEEESVDIYQINAVPGRTFGALRVPREFVEEPTKQKSIQEHKGGHKAVEKDEDVLGAYKFGQDATEDDVQRF